MNPLKFHLTIFKSLCASLLMAIAMSSALFAQSGEQDTTLAPLSLPAHNVEITDIEGRTITVSILETTNHGIKIRTATGQETEVLWSRLDQKSYEKIMGNTVRPVQFPFKMIYRGKQDPERGSEVTVTGMDNRSIYLIDALNNKSAAYIQYTSEQTLAVLRGEAEPECIETWRNEQAAKKAEEARIKEEEAQEKIRQAEIEKYKNRKVRIFKKREGKACSPLGSVNPREITETTVTFIRNNEETTMELDELCDQSVAALKEEIDDSSYYEKKLKEFHEDEHERRKQRMLVRLDGKTATANKKDLPEEIYKIVDAGNALKNKGYRIGGGHGKIEDSAYDCSGAISYLLIKAGLLESPITSKDFMEYGEPGVGKFVTIYAKPGHVFLQLGAIRFDTGDSYIHEGVETGPRWKEHARIAEGFVFRHPPGL